MEKITRYNIFGRYDCDGDKIPPIKKKEVFGRWVKFSDHKEMMKSKLSEQETAPFCPECKDVGVFSSRPGWTTYYHICKCPAGHRLKERAQ